MELDPATSEDEANKSRLTETLTKSEYCVIVILLTVNRDNNFNKPSKC
jgi:hypothetical protein